MTLFWRQNVATDAMDGICWYTVLCMIANLTTSQMSSSCELQPYGCNMKELQNFAYYIWIRIEGLKEKCHYATRKAAQRNSFSSHLQHNKRMTNKTNKTEAHPCSAFLNLHHKECK